MSTHLAPSDILSPGMAQVIEDLAGDWREVLARADTGCERLMSVPGIGPIISSATVAAIGVGDGFSKGRDFAAWLGLVPKQISTGDRTILGKISKRGNRYLRVLFVEAAWSPTRSNQRPDTLMQDRLPPTRQNPLAKHGRTIHWVILDS